MIMLFPESVGSTAVLRLGRSAFRLRREGCTHWVQKGINMFGILGWIVFGFIVGVLAKFLMPGRDPGGFIVTTLLGIVGAAVGGWLGRAMGLYGPDQPAGFLMALLGAVILLMVYRLVTGRRNITTAH
jgi:uncharacterized membrane protein YeaQ/YmgE (transglycosylase-associated protein family)